MAKPSKDSGFTLIELLIVVVIIGILAAIAIPNYTEYITRSKITQGIATLSDMRLKMEQFFQDNRTYVGACTNGTLAPPPVNTANFSFSCTATCGGVAAPLTATTYTIHACGLGSIAGAEYTIDQANTRTTVTAPSGWNGAGQTCWVTSKGGGC